MKSDPKDSLRTVSCCPGLHHNKAFICWRFLCHRKGSLSHEVGGDEAIDIFGEMGIVGLF